MVAAARLSFTGAAILRATPKSLAGVDQLRVPAGYEPLGVCIRLAAGRARPLWYRWGGDSQEIVDCLGVGERLYMD